MSWTALMVVGVLAQIPPAAPATAPQPANTAPYPSGDASKWMASPGQDSGGYGEYGVGQGYGLGSQQPPMSNAQGGDPNASAVPANANAGQYGPPAPVAGDGRTAPAAEKSWSTTDSNVLDRLFHLEDLQEKAAAAPRAETDNTAAPYSAAPYTGPPAMRYDPGVTNVAPAAPTTLATPSVATMPLPEAVHPPADEMLEKAMTLPSGTPVAGRQVSLLDVLGDVTDRAKRIAIAHAYWELARRLGEYRFCWEESRRIEDIQAGVVDPGTRRSAQQAADRDLTAAELALIQAQYELADAARLKSEQLPLPADRPHLKTYNTYFEEIFKDSTPPPGTRLLNRTLPVQLQVIDVRKDAVYAALDAYLAVSQAYQAGRANGADLLKALHEITNQRCAWITSVAQYNHSIADYGLAIAGPETTGRSLVAILIKLSDARPQTGNDKSAGVSSEGRPEVAQQEEHGESNQSGRPTLAPPLDQAAMEDRPEPAGQEEPDEGDRTGTPTLAPPPNQLTEAKDSSPLPPVPVAPVAEADLAVEPTSAEEPVNEAGEAVRDPAVAPAVAETPAPDSDVESKTTESEQAAPPPSAAVEQEDASPGARELAVQQARMVPVEDTDTTGNTRTVFRPPGSSTLSRYYEHLTNLPAAVRAQRLTEEFVGAAEVGRGKGQSVDLEECLGQVSGQRLREVIEAYWEASHRLAEYEVYRQHVKLLDNLGKAVTLGQAGTPAARAQLEVARLAAQADLLEAEARLLATQYELTKRCGRSLEAPWLVPKTQPHAGPYELREEVVSTRIANSWHLKKLATIIPELNRSLKARADAIIESDARRVEVIDAYWTQNVPFDEVLAAVEEQTRESLAFLNVLAAYNQSYADYAFSFVPDSIPKSRLVAMLVIR